MPAPLTAYFAKIDARLASVSAGTARELLRGEIGRWQNRYAEFQRQCARGTYDGKASADDYLVTIAGLDARLTGYEAAA